MALIDTATAFENGQIFEIFVVQLDVVALSLVISMRGVMAILDFWITDWRAMYGDCEFPNRELDP